MTKLASNSGGGWPADYLNGVQVVCGSNPPIPTILLPEIPLH